MTRADAYVTWDFDIAAPRQTVWEYFTVPGQWQKWWPTDGIIEHSAIGAGESAPRITACTARTRPSKRVLDWRPVDYFTVGILLPIPGAPKIVMTRAVRDGPNGATRLEMRVARPKPKDQGVRRSGRAERSGET